MARTRSIWPEWFTSAELAALSPLHRILYAGLPTVADWKGRGDDRPADLKIRLLPLDAVDVAAVDGLLTDLERIGLIMRYEAAGKRYFQITADEWKRQHCHVEEKKQQPRPGPTENRASHGVSPVDVPCESGASTVHAPGQNAYLLSLVSDHDHQKPSAGLRPSATRTGGKKRKEPTPEEATCRKAIHERIDAEHLARTGEPFEWGAGDGKENSNAARLATLCNNDPAKANRVIDTAIAKAAAGDSYFAGLSPSVMVSKINELRAWAARNTTYEQPRSRTENAAPASEVLAKLAATARQVEAERAAGFKPSRPPGAPKPRTEVAGG